MVKKSHEAPSESNVRAIALCFKSAAGEGLASAQFGHRTARMLPRVLLKQLDIIGFRQINVVPGLNMIREFVSQMVKMRLRRYLDDYLDEIGVPRELLRRDDARVVEAEVLEAAWFAEDL
jgi:hypothetical protein